MGLGRVGHAVDLDLGARFKFPELVFQHVKADFQVLRINDIEERNARSSCTVEGGVYAAHGARDGGGDGAVGKFALKLDQRGFGGEVAAVHTGLALEFFGGLAQVVPLVTLAHQDGLGLVFGHFQLGLVAFDLVFKDLLVQAHHHFSFTDALSQHNVKACNLLCNTAVDGHFGNGLDGSLTGEAFGLNGALQVLLRGSDLLRNGIRLGLRHRGRCAAVAGGEGQDQGKESESPIHTA